MQFSSVLLVALIAPFSVLAQTTAVANPAIIFSGTNAGGTALNGGGAAAGTGASPTGTGAAATGTGATGTAATGTGGTEAATTGAVTTGTGAANDTEPFTSTFTTDEIVVNQTNTVSGKETVVEKTQSGTFVIKETITPTGAAKTSTALAVPGAHVEAGLLAGWVVGLITFLFAGL